MKSRIQRSMVLIICSTLILGYALFVALIYSENLEAMKEDVELEAEYISTAINASDDEYLLDVSAYLQDSRITLIDSEGVVLFDTEEDASVMENHGGRVEVQEALESGSGYDTRMSSTIGKQTSYYAILLDSGEVLRVSKTTDSVLYTMLELLPWLMAIGAIIVLIAIWVSRIMTNRLIEPINKLDVENPLDNVAYEELMPLLIKMAESNAIRDATESMRREFSANVSHELKTPLTSISGYAELMKSGMVRSEDMERFSEKIYVEAIRLIHLVEDIIKLSRLDEGSVTLEKEEVDLYAMVRETVSRLSLQAEQKNIQVRVSGEPVLYTGIKPVLNEMIYNLCENAIKYNRQGGKIDIWVGDTLKGPKFSIQDTGIGIPEDQHDRIFERFYRVDKSHSKETGGTGLGLSIVKHGAILHKIKINLESHESVGTKIELLF